MSKFKDISLATIVRTLCLAFALFNQVLSACGHPMIPLDNAQMEQFLADCRRMGFNHQNLLTFFTLMPLAVSPELKCWWRAGSAETDIFVVTRQNNALIFYSVHRGSFVLP